MTDSNRQPRPESNRQRSERNGQDELGGYRTAMDVQETTMDQGQQVIRQTAELQRSFAQAALRGIESQQAAQRQAFEFTKAAIGSYVDTMNSMLPAIEDAQQQFAREAASAGAEMPAQFQETTREMGQQSEQFGQQMGQQPPETGQPAEPRSGGQTAQIPEQGGEFQRADAPHERGIRPQSGGQRGGGYQPPPQSGTQPQPPQQSTQSSPSGSTGRGNGQHQSRPPGTTGQSGDVADRRQSGPPTEERQSAETTGRGRSEFRGSGDRDEPSDRSGGRASPTHQQRQEPPQTGPPDEESSRREIPTSTWSERTRSSSQGPSSEYASRSDAGSESDWEREEPPE